VKRGAGPWPRALGLVLGLALAGAVPAPARGASAGDARQSALGVAHGLRLAEFPADGEVLGKPAQHAHPAKAGTAAPSGAQQRELQALSRADLERRIAAQRRLLRRAPADDGAFQNLSLIAIELGNRILDLDALGRDREIAPAMDLIRAKLHGSLWRTTQLAHSDSRAAAALGLFYSEGLLSERDAAKGCEAYARAAQGGHGAAAYQSALCNLRSDPALTRSLLRRAAEQGHAAAQELMGRACVEGEEKDSACAIAWLERAASKGRPSAMSLLAWVYANDARRSDLGKAADYYRAAAETGDLAAQNNLGELYETGRGVPRDAGLAFAWYARSADAGFAPAQLNLARLYAAGIGVEVNRGSAREWAERAQRQGQARAGEFLDWLAAQP
jgi:TPR repeat protein